MLIHFESIGGIRRDQRKLSQEVDKVLQVSDPLVCMVVSIPETKEFCVADQLHDQIAGSMDSYISTKDSEEVLPLVWR